MTKIAIIGGGLAGTACAYVLKQNGFPPVLFEAGHELAHGASGNFAGLYNPRFYAEKVPEALFYWEAFTEAAAFFSQVGAAIDHHPHASLHLATDADKEKRFQKLKDIWQWDDAQMQLLTCQSASEIAGIELPCGAMSLLGAGMVSPYKLCHFYAQGCEVHLKTPVTDLVQLSEGWQVNDSRFDVVIMACGAGTAHFPQTQWLPIYTVRGQMCSVRATEESLGLLANLCFGGYITPALDGVHACGATFQKWLHHTNVLESDNQDILGKLIKAVPSMAGMGDVITARASLRTAVYDRLPLIGRVVDAANHGASAQKKYIPELYLSTAHGSHGIVTTYMAAHMILDEIVGGKRRSYSKDISSDRFIKRLLIKNS